MNTINYEYGNKNSPTGDLANYLNLFSENNIKVKNTITFFPNIASSADSLEYVYHEHGYATFKNNGGVESYNIEYNCN